MYIYILITILHIFFNLKNSQTKKDKNKQFDRTKLD